MYKVASHGKCLHNVDSNDTRYSVNWQTLKIKQLEDYLFGFAAENHVIPNYVSEKVLNVILAGAIPIYMGASDIGDYIPSNKMIVDVAKYSSITELVNYLITIEAAIDKSDYSIIEPFFIWDKENYKRNIIDKFCPEDSAFICKVCEAVKEWKTKKQRI